MADNPKCPVCGDGSLRIGDGLPAYFEKFGKCSGVPFFLMFKCDSEECGVLFARRSEESKKADDSNH